MKKGTLYYTLAGIVLVVGIIVGATNSSTTDSDIASAQDTIDVTTTIQNQDQKTEYLQTVDMGTTALGALEALERDGEIDLEETDYDFGTLVDSINGVGDDTADNHYWIYYVNDKVSDVGASDYTLENGDTVLWNYEEAIN